MGVNIKLDPTQTTKPSVNQALKDFQLTLSQQLEAKTSSFIQEQIKNHAHVQDSFKLRKSLQIPFLPITLPCLDANAMLKEALDLTPQFTPHGFDGNLGWSSLCLHGIDSQKTLSFDRYNYRSEEETPYTWTSASTACPVTTLWLQNLLDQKYYHQFYRVRFMRLEPGGYIRFHRDIPEDQSRLGPVNIALNMPDHCYFLFKRWGQLHFAPGQSYFLDVSHEHGVWNNSIYPRIHIIIHGAYGPNYYQQLFHQLGRQCQT